MTEEIHHPDGRIEHPSVRYERTDASFRWILAILLAAVVFLALFGAIVLGFFHYYRDYQAKIKRSPFPLAPGPSTALPREPRLEQIDRLSGIEAGNVFARESGQLKTLFQYGPTSDKGFIHIPIERAMKLIVDKKMLPARQEPPPEDRRRSGGLVDAGEPNSGRLFKERPK